MTTQAQTLFSIAVDSLRSTLTRSSVPIFAGGPQRAHVAGTGTLFQIDGTKFLITAAHVAELRQGATELALADAEEGSRLFHLTEKAWVLPSDVSPLDVAVFELHQRSVDAMPTRQFLTLADVDFSPRAFDGGGYAVHGFPLGMSEFEYAPSSRIKVGALTAGSPLQPPRDDLDGFDERAHVLLLVERMARGVPASLKGISGCSVWRLFREHDTAERWTPNVARVVALQTSQYRHSREHMFVRATRWVWVLATILQYRPELRPAVDVSAAAQGATLPSARFLARAAAAQPESGTE